MMLTSVTKILAGKLALFHGLAKVQIDFPGAHSGIYLWAPEFELHL